MGTHKYRKKEPATVQGICVACEVNLQTGIGSGKFRPLCKPCHLRRYSMLKGGKCIEYRKYKGDRCEFCGFIAKHACQLDVDHIDGDHSNNDPENLQTLCACCHRLKTFEDQAKERAARVAARVC